MLDRMLPLFRRYYSPCQPPRGHDSHQELPRHQAVHTRLASQIWHQELPAVRGQDGLHPRRRNLHGPGQGPPLAPPWITRQCCPPSRGELAGHQQEPHAVHGPLLQLCCAHPPAEERAGSPGRGHRHANLQALPGRGRYEFRCRGALCAIAWKDRKPIHFLSNCHDPRKASTENRRVGDWLVQLTAPQLVVDYTR